MSKQPSILFLKQSVAMRTYFIELGQDLAEMVGPCSMYAATETDLELGKLTIRSGPAYRKDSDWMRVRTWLQYAIGAAWHTLRTPGKPLLFIVTQSPFLPFIGYFRNRLWKQRYVLWVDDVHPEQFTRLGRLRENGWIAGLWRAFNRIVFDRADCIFTLGECMAQTLAQSLRPASRNKIVIVPTWTDVDAIRPIPKNENWFAVEHDQTDKLTFLYSGNLGFSHDLSTALEAAKELRDHKGLHFMIIGQGPRWDELKSMVARYELTNVTMLPFQPVDVLPYSLTTGEVAIVSLGTGIEGVSMPSKTYHTMSAGAAILGLSHAPSDLQLVIERHKCGLYVEPGDISGFVKAVRRFYEDRAFLEACRKNARRAAVKEFSRAVNVERVFKQIEPLIPVDGLH